MEPEETQPEVETKKSIFTEVTPLSKYLAMTLFVLMPFVGGWIGYNFAPEKVVEVEKIVIKEVEVNDTDAETNQKPEDFVEYDVVIKENTKNENLSDIYLQNTKTQELEFFTTISDVYRTHYRPASYKNGELYIIRRIGYDRTKFEQEDWRDELWRYPRNEEGRMIFANQGIDFLASDDGEKVAIFMFYADQGHTIVILDKNGEELKVLNREDLKIDESDEPTVSPLMWHQDNIWVSSGFTAAIYTLTKIDVNDFSTQRYHIKNLIPTSITSREFDLEPFNQRIVFSNHPAIFDVDSAEDFELSKEEVILYLYDLQTDTLEEIDKSTTKYFNPKWISENEIEYDDPAGESRISVILD